MRKQLVGSLISLFLLAPTVRAETQPVAEIRSAAEAAAIQQMTQPGISLTAAAQVDESLVIQHCADLLRTAAQNAGGAVVTVAVSCANPVPWTLYVPVRLQRHAEVVVLARPARSGEVLTQDALWQQSRDVGQLPGGYLLNTQQALGAALQRNLPAGAVLTAQDLKAPTRIRRGDPVTLLASSGGVEVRAQGRALSDAAVDERIRVENGGTRKVVEGWVRQDGLVMVRP